jgi:hypothetical protein
MSSFRGVGVPLIAIALLVPSASTAGPWWSTARFTPDQKTIEGIPVKAIDPHWKVASVLTERALPPEAAEWFCMNCDNGAPIVATGADHYKLGPGVD